MGISESLVLLGSNSWEPLSQTHNPYTLVRNTRTFILGELYSLVARSLEYQIDLYSWRKHASSSNIVSVHAVSVEKNNLELCGEGMQMRVITEHLEPRLDNIQLLEHEEVIKILVAAVSAFKVLTNKFGFFRVSPRMIGFTKEGEVKVWINSNFSLNVVEEEIVNNSDRIRRDKLQNFMVQQLLAEMRLKTVDATKVDLIREEMAREGIRSFDQVARFLSQQPKEFRMSLGPHRSPGHAQKKIQQQIIGTEQNLNRVVPVMPQRVISTAKVQPHQSPPPRIQPRPIETKATHYFNSPQQLRFASPKPLSRFLHRVKSEEKPLFTRPPQIIEATIPNFHPKPFNHSTGLQFQKASTPSTLNQTNIVSSFTPTLKFNRGIERKAVPISYNKYKERARIISDFGGRESEGIIVTMDDHSIVTTTSRDQKPDDYIQIVGNS